MKKIIIGTMVVGIVGSVFLFGTNIRIEYKEPIAGAVAPTYEFISENKDNNYRTIRENKIVTETKTDEFTLFSLREKIENIKGQIISLQAEQARLQAIYDSAKLNLNIQ